MYDISQFKPALYLLILLGISGFALAAQTPELWVIGFAGVLLNGWLVHLNRFRPLPRIVANLVTLGAVLYIGHELFTSGITPVLVIGQFLVMLQLVKLWEQRGNRDYAQLLILSLLLMVAASINTASMWFGIMLIGYLFLSLYCCLLFHLKVETDAAKAALAVPMEKLSPLTLRQDQRYLPRSMRRLTGLVSGVAIVFAVLIFLFFPRGGGAGILGPLQARRAAPLTGFSDEVRFQDVARITQNHERIAYVKVWHNDELSAGQTLLLRGVSLDSYRYTDRMGGAWEWTRDTSGRSRFYMRDVAAGETLALGSGSDQWRQQITLFPTHTNVLFAMPGLISFTPHAGMRIGYSRWDEALQTPEPPRDQMTYDVTSSNSSTLKANGYFAVPSAEAVRGRFQRIYQLARNPKVSGQDVKGPLADQRLAQGAAITGLDEQIASNIEHYFRNNFTYTLDLTDEKSVRGREPLELFLYDWEKGHCEYFAGAMTLMCQTLGMQARMVVGFRCSPDAYNDWNHLYTVYQSDAHAWVEVRTPEGWKTFDPTSSREAERPAASGLVGRMRHLIDFLEYTYANSVIAYDGQNRDTILASVETGLANTAIRGNDSASRLKDFLGSYEAATFWNVSTLVLSGIVLFMTAVVAASLGWFVFERWRLRRRAQRIGIESLPEADQLRLARQLGFYDDLLRVLGRHRITRPPHFTPMEFSRSLTFLPAEPYDTVRRLTELFYKVRYGGTELPTSRQRRLSNVLSRLAHELGRSIPG